MPEETSDVVGRIVGPNDSGLEDSVKRGYKGNRFLDRVKQYVRPIAMCALGVVALASDISCGSKIEMEYNPVSFHGHKYDPATEETNYPKSLQVGVENRYWVQFDPRFDNQSAEDLKNILEGNGFGFGSKGQELVGIEITNPNEFTEIARDLRAVNNYRAHFPVQLGHKATPSLVDYVRNAEDSDDVTDISVCPYGEIITEGLENYVADNFEPGQYELIEDFYIIRDCNVENIIGLLSRRDVVEVGLYATMKNPLDGGLNPFEPNDYLINQNP